jgi:kynurenine formamidase
MVEHYIPSREEILAYLQQKRNWGRWGADDQLGAINLITPQKRLQAASLVKTGRAVSLSRDVPTIPGRNNPVPAQHFMRIFDGGCVDFYGITYHGYLTTHIDALCHVWPADGMWNGRDPKVEITTEGARFGSIDKWRDGITTRGVLLDVPKFRGEPSVTIERPVHGWELDAVAEAQGVKIEPGDAVVVHSGREAWQSAHPDWSGYRPPSPGLHSSCLPFLREHDVSALVWDLMDAQPDEYGFPLSVHPALPVFGVALVDNALVEPLARACAEEGRYEFMLTVAPLAWVGGTGSPVNPIALL